MSVWESMDRRARKLGVLDTKLAQGAAIFFALVIVKLIPEIMRASIWLFLLLAVLCGIKPAITFFGGSDRVSSALKE
jgi:hypothetical protein